MKNLVPNRLLHLYLAAAALVLSATSARALELGVFELDGNAITDHAGTALPDDWNRINPGPGSHALVSSFDVDPLGATIFTGGGSKDVQDVSQWLYTSGSVPDKDEINDAFAAAYTGSTGHVLIYFGADRFDNSGDSQIGFWFFQDQISLKPPKRSGTGGFNGVHTVGDILILSDFTTGGSISTVRVFEWVGSGGSDGPLNLRTTGGPCNTASSTDPLCAIVNAASQQAPWAFQSKSGPAGTFPPGTFFEGFADLSDPTVLPNLECFASFLVETRSSASVTATLKDFVLGNFTFAPTVSVADNTICQGGSGMLTAVVSGGVGTPSFSWTGPNGFTATTQTITPSAAGTYTVTVTTSLNCHVSKSAVLTVNPNPGSSITPTSAQICAGSSQMFTANITSGTAPFQISWTGPNNFTSSSATITVATSGTYTVNITDAKGCTTSSSANLVVNPHPVVQIGGPPNCSTVPAMLTANVTGGTGTPTFSWTGPGGFTSTASSISVSTGGTYNVTVTDSKGCHGQASIVLGLCVAQ